MDTDKWVVKYENINSVVVDFLQELEKHGDKKVRVNVQGLYALIHLQRARVNELLGEVIKAKVANEKHIPDSK